MELRGYEVTNNTQSKAMMIVRVSTTLRVGVDDYYFHPSMYAVFSCLTKSENFIISTLPEKPVTILFILYETVYDEIFHLPYIQNFLFYFNNILKL